MELVLSARALRDYSGLPITVKKRVDKQLTFLLRNLRHPSLRAKKYDEAKNVWQARATGEYRFYFQIRGNVVHIITIIKHPK